MTSVPPPRNWWPWFPVIGLIVVAVPNIVMLVASQRVRPTAVSAQPYLESQRQGDRDAERKAFAAAGLRFTTQTLAHRRVEFTLVAMPGTAAPASAELRFYRPDNAGLDRRVPWSDPSQPFTVELPRGGRWRVTLNVLGSDGVIRAKDEELDAG